MQRKRRHALALVSNRLEVNCALPARLIAGHVLRRATPEEVGELREMLEQHSRIHADLRNIYEYDYESASPSTATPVPLPEPQWRYFVVEVRRSKSAGPINKGVTAIEDASSLTDVELRFHFWLITPWGRMVSDPDSLGFDHLCKSVTRSCEVVDDELVKRISRIDRRIRRETERHADLKRAMGLYRQVRGLKSPTLLRILGQFAVLESLLTHNPEGGYDSLGHQIRTKIPLLSRRFRRPLDYSVFGHVPTEKIWKKLYDYRSRIAHGGALDFGSSLQVLRNGGIVEKFLDGVVKSLVSHALEEPELVLDLKKC